MSLIIDPNVLRSVLMCLKSGGIIAYPTEAVYGLGCDPFNFKAVAKLLTVKKRSVEKGLILVAADWEQIEYLIEPIPPAALAQVLSTWPGPYTWVFPARSSVPEWIRGKHKTVAVRISAHPIVKELCQAFASCLVSTSANKENDLPARDSRMVEILFHNQIDFVLSGPLGSESNPTTIRDAVTGMVLRKA